MLKGQKRCGFCIGWHNHRSIEQLRRKNCRSAACLASNNLLRWSMHEGDMLFVMILQIGQIVYRHLDCRLDLLFQIKHRIRIQSSGDATAEVMWIQTLLREFNIIVQELQNCDVTILVLSICQLIQSFILEQISQKLIIILLENKLPDILLLLIRGPNGGSTLILARRARKKDKCQKFSH